LYLSLFFLAQFTREQSISSTVLQQRVVRIDNRFFLPFYSLESNLYEFIVPSP